LLRITMARMTNFSVEALRHINKELHCHEARLHHSGTDSA